MRDAEPRRVVLTFSLRFSGGEMTIDRDDGLIVGDTAKMDLPAAALGREPGLREGRNCCQRP